MILVAFGAHPDDVELAAAGTVARAVALGHRAWIVDLTRGERGTAGTPEIRDEEARTAARILGAERRTLDLPDTGLSRTDPIQRRAVVEAIRRHRPDLILAPTGGDRHPDHIETHHLVRNAVFLARLANHEPEAGAPHRTRAVLFYPSSREPLADPDLIVDVSATIDQKMSALARYTSQFVRPPGGPATRLNEPGFLERIRARAAAVGLEAGVAFGEAFRAERPFLVSDPFQVLAAGRPAENIMNRGDER